MIVELKRKNGSTAILTADHLFHHTGEEGKDDSVQVQVMDIIADIFSGYGGVEVFAKKAAREIRRREELFVTSYNGWED